METAKLSISCEAGRRWVCLVLAFCLLFLCFGLPFQTAKALVEVSAAAIAVIIAGLAAVGITFASTNAYQSLSSYVSSLLGQYAQEQGVTVDSLLTGTQVGVNTAGKLLLNNRYVMLINAFGLWLKLKFNLVDNTTSVLVNQTGWKLTNGTFIELGRNGTRFYMDELYQVEGGSYWTVIKNVDNGYYYVMTRNGLEYFSMGPTHDLDGYALGEGNQHKVFIFWYQGSNYKVGTLTTTLVNDFFGPQLQEYVGIDVGTITLPQDDTDYSSGDGALIDVAAPWGSTINDITDRVIPGEWAAGQTGSPAITYDTPNAVAGQIDPTASYPISNSPNDYQTPGLKDVFPFCIPWDIYSLLSALAADPVAPHFDWRFYMPGLVDQTVTIDLAAFDTVAQIVRTMELLAFCVGLAFETRNLIRG